MSTSITIGEVPDEVRDELAARAALCGRSLEDYIRDELMALTKRPSAAVWMARVRARKDALQNQRGDAQRGDVQRGDVQRGELSGAHVPKGESEKAGGEPPSSPRASEAPVEQRDVG